MEGQGPVQNPQYSNPSKVIHIRNLPFDVTDDEIRELCSQWGQVVAVKSKIGANRNQAFLEMAYVQQAMAIVGHYQHSAEAAKIRGRPVYINYSGRDKLTNMTSTDLPTPVLHVQMKNVLPDVQPHITLDLLNMVFGAFGYVAKAIMHADAQGAPSAWLQFPDPATAAQVKNTLQGQQIPRHLLGEHPNPPTLHLSFSPHADLPVTVQSYYTRDFSNAALPWGEPDPNALATLLPLGEASNVLTINFDQATYPVTLEGVHTICSTYGFVQKIHIFDRDGKTVALVQYPDSATAQVAKQALDGHPMYDGGHNVMRPLYSKHRNLTIRPGERSRDYTQPQGAQPSPGAVGAGGAAPAAQMGGGAAGGMAGGAAPAAEGTWGGGGGGGEQGSGQPGILVTGEDYVKAHEEVLKTYAPGARSATLQHSPVVPPQQQQQQQQQQHFGMQQPGMQQPGLPPPGMLPPHGMPPHRMPQQGGFPQQGFGGAPMRPAGGPYGGGPPPAAGPGPAYAGAGPGPMGGGGGFGGGPPFGVAQPSGPGGYGGPPMRPPYGGSGGYM